ncbi:hypothetical protein HY994_02530 [Candidatus Micrarchaeota archaeon]|nr:hypothetical protein [Candidatus Micrarchaeota archaeon]
MIGGAGGFVGGHMDASSAGVRRSGRMALETYSHGNHPHGHFYVALCHHVFPRMEITPEQLIHTIDPIAKKVDVHPYIVLKLLLTAGKNNFSPAGGRIYEQVAKEARRLGDEPIREGEAYSKYTPKRIFGDLQDKFKEILQKQPNVIKNLHDFGEEHFSEENQVPVRKPDGSFVMESPGYVFKPENVYPKDYDYPWREGQRHDQFRRDYNKSMGRGDGGG